MNMREEERDLSALYCTVLYCTVYCYVLLL